MPANVLLDHYKALVCDLDGVVYRGAEAIPGAVRALEEVAARGIGLAFATNNASRPPEAVVAHLGKLGLPEGSWSVVTSSEAAATHLASFLAPGARVLAVGGPGVSTALQRTGLAPVRLPGLADGPVQAVVQGLGTDVSWKELDEVAHLAREGIPWVATNLDISLPGARGPSPGNGALVAVVRAATDAQPHVVGKPAPDLFELARRRLGAAPPDTLVIGDRLDTDVAGARAAGLDSLLVLSGATSAAELAAAPPEWQPTYVAADLTGLLERPVVA